MSAIIEVFVDDSPESSVVIKKVQELACPKCEIFIYSLNDQSVATEREEKTKEYGIASVPAVVMNGRIIDMEKGMRLYT
jgi:hypothetical protein